MNVPANQHFVPQLVSRRFLDADNKFWFFDKTVKSKFRDKIVKKGTKKSFSGLHIYTSEDAHGVQDTALETIFGSIENKAAQLHVKIINAVRDNKLPSLSSQEIETWNEYLFFQWKRTPDALGEVKTLTQFEDALEHTILKLLESTKVPEEKLRAFQADAEKARLKQNVTVQALSTPSLRVMWFLRQRGLVFAKTPKSGKTFLLGSQPVAWSKQGLLNPNNEIWLPIAPDVAVGVSSDAAPSQKLITLNNKTLDQINQRIFDQSSSVASASKALITSFLKRR